MARVKSVIVTDNNGKENIENIKEVMEEELGRLNLQEGETFVLCVRQVNPSIAIEEMRKFLGPEEDDFCQKITGYLCKAIPWNLADQRFDFLLIVQDTKDGKETISAFGYFQEEVVLFGA